MTKERLQSLPLSKLRGIAQKEGIDVPSGTVRATLIDLIYEAMEEDRTEREAGNNSAIQVEEKKYEILQDEELEIGGDHDFSISESYNETKIFLLLRDPLWAFAYWDIRDCDREDMKTDMHFDKLFLRVFELDEKKKSAEIIDSFDIPIKFTDDRWYINLPRAGSTYFIALMYRTAGGDRELCRSNTVHSPEKTLLDISLRDELIESIDNEMLILSGLYDYVESSSFRENIPQRIISMVDAAAHYTYNR